MSRVPGRTVTVLFTDLVGSTELLQRLGDEAVEPLRRAHYRLLREAIAAWGGSEVKTLGDGLMAVFSSAVDGAGCAVAMQQAADSEASVQPERLNMRAGLDVGEPIRDGDDYHGTPVVMAKRLCDSAAGGQIVVSELVHGLVGPRRGHTFQELAPLRLKGIAQPVRAFELVWQRAAGVEERPRPPRSRGAAAPLPLPPLLAAREGSAFVGRAPELEQVVRCWNDALAGQGRFVLLSGESGIGKTRLAAQFAASAHAAGATVLFGHAEERPLAPCQPVVEALRQLSLGVHAEEQRERIGEAGARHLRRALEWDGDGADTGEGRSEFVEDVSALLVALAELSPLLFVLDDLQWADETTLQLLARVMRDAAKARVLVLATCREGEPGSAPALRDAVAGLRRQGVLARVVIGGLGEGDVGEMMGAWGGAAPSHSFVRAVYDQTEGNPFFIEQVLIHLGETQGEGTLDPAAYAAGVPEGVKDVIDSRLSRLSEECNGVLAFASVIGREFGLEGLERASDLPPDRLLDALDEAAAARIVDEIPGAAGRFRFAHDLVYEALYESLGRTRRVRLHGQTLQYADNNGVKIAYEVLGASGPFVVATGVSNCPAIRTRNWMSTRRWERLARNCRVILYDRRGVGFSSAPASGYSVRAAVEDLRAVLDAAGADRVVLWGATDGGPLAIAFAVQYPGRAAGLLLLGTSAKYMNSEDYQFGVNLSLAQSFLQTEAVDHGRAVSDLTQARVEGAGAESIGEVVRRVPRRIWTKIVGGLAAADVRDVLSDVDTKTLIIHDPGNRYIPVEAARYLHQRIAGSELLVTEEYGTPMLGEGVFARIDDFIRQASGVAPWT